MHDLCPVKPFPSKKPISAVLQYLKPLDLSPLKQSLANYWVFLKTHPLKEWFYLFFFINLAFGMSGASNAGVRFATLCAMVEDQSFQIDRYAHLSVDWSRTPDGHYYSSKAPGPTLMAFPIFWTLDKLVTLGAHSQEERDQRRLKARGTTMPIVCFLLITLPFSFLVFLWLSRMERAGLSLTALTFTTVALFFGNTTSFFFNSLFNHGILASLVLALLLAILDGHFFLVGWILGWTILSDYSSTFLIFPLLTVLFLSKTAFKSFLQIGWGGCVPAALFFAYNYICFGHPFSLPYQFVNPEFVGTLAPEKSLWGVVSLLPQWSVFGEFLWGRARGLLWTQPWMLFLLGSIPNLQKSLRSSRESRMLFIFFVPSLFILIWFFASYGPWWHGGDSPGPRFISAAFPGLALLAGYSWPSLSSLTRRIWVFGLVAALLLYMAVFGALLFPNDTGPIWGFYWRYYFHQANGFSFLRLGILGLVFAYTARLHFMRSVKPNRARHLP